MAQIDWDGIRVLILISGFLIFLGKSFKYTEKKKTQEKDDFAGSVATPICNNFICPTIYLFVFSFLLILFD